jgi:23S rRNA pseudouridine2605 synthase
MSKTEAERIHKVLSNAGLGSRRQIEGWIREGRIKVNGKPAGIGDRIVLSDRISLDDKPIKLQSVIPTTTRIIACYKPAGLICTRNDPEGRKTVFDDLPRLTKGRWINIGRLDINTTGLLLFTNNGELANRFMHPSSNIEREYAVRTLGTATDRQLDLLREGIMLEDGQAGFSMIMDVGGEGTNHWYHVVLTEGRNREVRRLWESQGLKVSRLIRVRYGSYQLPRKKRPGQCWELEQKDIDALLQDIGVEPAPVELVQVQPERDKKPESKKTDKRRFETRATDRQKPDPRKTRTHKTDTARPDNRGPAKRKTLTLKPGARKSTRRK